MAPFTRFLMALSIFLLAAGAGAVSTHSSWSTSRSHRAGNTASSTTTRPPRATTTRPTRATTTVPPASGTTTPAGAAPDSAALAGGLITPTDMGGYYRIVPTAAASLLDSAPCLAGMQGSPAQAGRAVTALLGPDYHSVPTVVEVVASYPGDQSRPVFDALARSLDSCANFSFSFGGAPVSSALAPSTMPAVGDADQVWAGTFASGGNRFSVEIGVVLDGPEVIGLVWIDSVPGSDPVMGNFTSTVSLAIGKLA